MIRKNSGHAVKLKRDTWWLSPLFLIALNFLITVIAFLQSDNSFVVEYRSHKWIGLSYVLLSALAIFLLWSGAYFGRNERARKPVAAPQRPEYRRVYKAFYVITIVCLAAYLIWVLRFILIWGAGSLLTVFNSNVLSDNMYAFKRNSGSIAGVTSLTEFGVVSAILGAYCLNSKESSKAERQRIMIMLLTLLLFAYWRSRINSERLALIELIVPFAIAWMGTSGGKLKGIDGWIPFIAIGVLVLVFGAFEYSRSWLTYYVNYYDSFWDFIVMRVFGYYTNASNTEAMFVANGEISVVPYWSIHWLWQMPGMANIYDAIAPCNVGTLFGNLLGSLATKEFNNPGGVLTFYKDFWVFGFILYFIFGFIVGENYERFRHGELFGAIFYPVIVLTLIELPRYFYLGENRGFIVMVGLALFWFIAIYKRPGSAGHLQNEQERG